MRGGVALLATLGLSPAVVTESYAALSQGLAGAGGGMIRRVAILRTSDERVEACADILKRAFGKLGVDVLDLKLASRDIASARDNAEAYQAAVHALEALAAGGDAIAVSIAGGRKTLPAILSLAVFVDPSLERVRGRVVLIMHVLAPPSVEQNERCRRVCVEVKGLEEEERERLAELIARRLREGLKPCSSGAQPPEGRLEPLAWCFAPCAPEIAALPGPGVNVIAIYAAARKRLNGPAGLGDCTASVDTSRINEAAARLVDSMWEIVDIVNVSPLPRSPECRPIVGGFSQLDHHARVCGHLDDKIQYVVDEVEYIVGFKALGLCLKKGSEEACRGYKLVEPEPSKGIRGYSVEVALRCGRGGCGVVKGVFHTTAVTRGQAMVAAEAILKKLEEHGLC